MKGAPGGKETAVFDASPLIFLGRVGLLDKAIDLFSESLIPRSVKEEVVDAGIRIGSSEAVVIGSLLERGLLTAVAAPSNPLTRRLEKSPHLSRADRECLVLAFERGARILADDAAVRVAARHLRIPLGGTLYVLFALVKRGDLKPADGIGYLDALIDEGWFCSAALYRRAREELQG